MYFGRTIYLMFIYFKLDECKFAQNRRKEIKSVKTKKVESKSRSATSLVC